MVENDSFWDENTWYYVETASLPNEGEEKSFLKPTKYVLRSCLHEIAVSKESGEWNKTSIGETYCLYFWAVLKFTKLKGGATNREILNRLIEKNIRNDSPEYFRNVKRRIRGFFKENKLVCCLSLYERRQYWHGNIQLIDPYCQLYRRNHSAYQYDLDTMERDIWGKTHQIGYLELERTFSLKTGKLGPLHELYLANAQMISGKYQQSISTLTSILNSYDLEAPDLVRVRLLQSQNYYMMGDREDSELYLHEAEKPVREIQYFQTNEHIFLNVCHIFFLLVMDVRDEKFEDALNKARQMIEVCRTAKSYEHSFFWAFSQCVFTLIKDTRKHLVESLMLYSPPYFTEESLGNESLWTQERGFLHGDSPRASSDYFVYFFGIDDFLHFMHSPNSIGNKFYIGCLNLHIETLGQQTSHFFKAELDLLKSALKAYTKENNLTMSVICLYQMARCAYRLRAVDRRFVGEETKFLEKAYKLCMKTGQRMLQIVCSYRLGHDYSFKNK